MTEEKPLHVQVAEALGWENIRQSHPGEERGEAWVGCSSQQLPNIVSRVIPRYDTDWSATGPLIEKFSITLLGPYVYRDDDPRWHASQGFRLDLDQVGGDYEVAEATPLLAVCHLILALSAAGKLPK